MSADAGAALAALLFGDKSKGGSAFRIGVILAAGDGALRISCDGLQLEPEDLWLVPGMSYKYAIESDDGSDDGKLRTGDRVLMLSADGQDYYLISKAVKA